MDRCQSCHWWDRHEPPFDTGWGACRLISGDEGVGTSTLASAAGRDPGEGSLLTRASFGCVQFVPIGHPSAWVGKGVPA